MLKFYRDVTKYINCKAICFFNTLQYCKNNLITSYLIILYIVFTSKLQYIQEAPL